MQMALKQQRSVKLHTHTHTHTHTNDDTRAHILHVRGSVRGSKDA